MTGGDLDTKLQAIEANLNEIEWLFASLNEETKRLGESNNSPNPHIDEEKEEIELHKATLERNKSELVVMLTTMKTSQDFKESIANGNSTLKTKITSYEERLEKIQTWSWLRDAAKNWLSTVWKWTWKNRLWLLWIWVGVKVVSWLSRDKKQEVPTAAVPTAAVPTAPAVPAVPVATTDQAAPTAATTVIPKTHWYDKIVDRFRSKKMVDKVADKVSDAVVSKI